MGHYKRGYGFIKISEFIPIRINQLKKLIRTERNIEKLREYKQELQLLSDPGTQLFFGPYKNWPTNKEEI